jgi:hypothetical protein
MLSPSRARVRRSSMMDLHPFEREANARCVGGVTGLCQQREVAARDRQRVAEVVRDDAGELRESVALAFEFGHLGDPLRDVV